MDLNETAKQHAERLNTDPETVKSIIRAMFDTEQERRERFELRLNAYLKSVLRGDL